MIIEIKGTKEADGADVAAERYQFKEAQQLSRLPLFVGVAITAIVGFVRGATPEIRLPMPEEPKATPEHEPRAAFGDPVLTKLDRPAWVQDEHEKNDIPLRQDHSSSRAYHRYDDNVVQFHARRHVLVDSPPITYEPAGPTEFPGAEAADPFGGNGSSHAGTETPRAANKAPPAETESDEERRNRAPQSSVGNIRLTEAFAGTAMLIGFDELLEGAVDPDGDALSVRNVRVSSGAITETEEGYLYSSNKAADTQNVVVTFELTDGKDSIQRAAYIPLVRGPIRGSSTSEAVLGTNWADQIDGLAGDDIIDGLGGDDFILGGDGDDIIVAGAGHDVVFAGAGNDVVLGGEGNDHIAGGEGDDRLDGEAGNDTLLGEAGNDQLRGGDGDDFASGGEGDDVIDGEGGADILDGGSGQDQLRDGAGQDRVFGGEGDDTAIAALDAVTDFFSGGEGVDTLDYSATTEAVTFNFVAETAEGVEVGTDTITEFEAVIGGGGSDTFLIGDHELELTGGDGEDTFVFALPEHIDRPMLVHDILDFVVGDRIKVAAFEFTMSQHDEEEDRFERYYRDREEDDVDALELRIRHTLGDEGELTVFEFDADGNFEFEMTIAVHGNHQPFVYETPTA
jgi:Ca2+-binding RTX toxin-like protein